MSSLSSLQGHAGTPHASQDRVQDCGGEVAPGRTQAPQEDSHTWITYVRGTGFKAARAHLETLAPQRM